MGVSSVHKGFEELAGLLALLLAAALAGGTGLPGWA